LESSSTASTGPAVAQRRTVRDPIAIRALAHPLRLQLRDLLDVHGPLTAAEAARELGTSQGLASHHLRQLAKYGFVEPAPARNDRDRPWQITETSVSWLGAETEPDGAAAADLLEQVLAERALRHLHAWQRRRHQEPRWHDHSGLSQHLLYLTAEELAGITAAIEALLEPYARRRPAGGGATGGGATGGVPAGGVATGGVAAGGAVGSQPADSPEGALVVDLTVIGVPLPGPAGRG
jgi:DNA-binding transcriptional ArsR family regulator